MVNVDSQTIWLANSALNATGVVSAANAWSSLFDRRLTRLLWLAPIILLSAWLETHLNPAFAGAAAMNSAMYKHMALDLGVFAGVALLFVLWKRKPALGGSRSVKPRSVIGNEIKIDTRAIANPELHRCMENFLNSADRGDVASLATLYDRDFLCVRVADGGGFVRLSREQMLSFLDRAVNAARGDSAQGGHPAVQTKETAVHFGEAHNDTAFVLMTRIKDLGSGWEPMFYSLVWKKRDGNWRLLREFVHQKTAPQWH